MFTMSKIQSSNPNEELDVVGLKNQNQEENYRDVADEVSTEDLKKELLASQKISLENFNWDLVGKKSDVYKDEERSSLEKMYNTTIASVEPHHVYQGKVIQKTKRDVVINIGYKSEGVVPLNEFRYNPDLKEGDLVEIYIESQEDRNGQLAVSHTKARTVWAWRRVNQALETGEVVTGYVKCRTKGGLIVDVFGIEAFLPGSQIDVKPIRDYDIYVNKNMEFKVVKINNEFKNVVVSHKALIEAEIEQQKVDIMSKLEKGQVLEGVVKNVTSYGVFVDLGGVDGLIHITDLSWGRISHPEEIVQVDQKINVVILDFDDDKKRIALGLKQLQSHPWDSLVTEYNVGDKVKGKVVILLDYGAFVEIQPGVEGLVHVSEMSWSQNLKTASDFFKVGDEVEAVIMSLDKEERKMSLSTRRLMPDPWANIEQKYPIGSKHTGKVASLSNFGVFVQLEEGIDGLVHISDLSWSKKVNHPSEITKAGEQMDIVILEIDKDNRRISLGHKQLEENPWDVFETVFSIGSVHTGTVTSETDKGYVVSLPYGIEGFCPGKHGVKEDGAKLKADDKNEFMIIEFNKNSKKIIVSHARIHEEAKKENDEQDLKDKRAKGKTTRKAINKLQDSMERTTLGDLNVLSSLKDEMEQAEKSKKKD